MRRYAFKAMKILYRWKFWREWNFFDAIIVIDCYVTSFRQQDNHLWRYIGVACQLLCKLYGLVKKRIPNKIFMRSRSKWCNLIKKITFQVQIKFLNEIKSKISYVLCEITKDRDGHGAPFSSFKNRRYSDHSSHNKDCMFIS